MFGRWLSIPEGMPLLALLVAAYFAARDRQQSETLRDPGLGQHQHLGPDTHPLAMSDGLLITAGALRTTSLSLSAMKLSARRVISSREYRISGTRE